MGEGPLTFDIGRVREYAGGIVADDNVLSMIAEGVERSALVFCGREAWLATSYTDKITLRDPAERVFLRHRPVMASPAPTVTLDGIVVDVAQYEFDLNAGIIYRVPGSTTWPVTYRGLVVVYTSGLAVTAADMPGDLVLAMVKQTAYEYKSAGRSGRLGAVRQALDTGQVISEYIVTDWAPGVGATLQRYQYRRT
jgi:hypothetical protein